MNRLRSELRRLYASPAATDDADGLPQLIDARGDVRALVMEVARPASWEVLGKVWHAVQSELELPAPGIAVSGTDGLQLWFSISAPVPATEAHAFLDALRVRYLPDVAPQRLRLLPSSTASPLHANVVPAPAGSDGNWSAFVAADLAPVFADTPWLDFPPSEEGQASLLRGLESIKPSAFQAAAEKLASPTPATPDRPAAPEEASASDPAHFLRRVMLDDTVSLALRIEAAKALLPYSRGR